MKNIIKFLSFLSCLLGCLHSSAQNTLQGNMKRFEKEMSRDSWPRDTLDYAWLCVHYRQLVRKDTLSPDDFTASEMILQIGNQMSNYTNWINLHNDSIVAYELNNTDESVLAISNRSGERTYKSGDYQTILKNYPEGRTQVQSRVFFDRYLYEEDSPVFNWQLEKEESEWLGYKCRKATCTFRGRHYTAWYVPDIPLSNGPWKFTGLPGLILRVSDARGDYVFDATALYKVTWRRPIFIWKRPQEIKTTREKFLKAERAGMANPGFNIQASGKVKDVSDIRKKFPYNPMELE